MAYLIYEYIRENGSRHYITSFIITDEIFNWIDENIKPSSIRRMINGKLFFGRVSNEGRILLQLHYQIKTKMDLRIPDDDIDGS